MSRKCRRTAVVAVVFIALVVVGACSSSPTETSGGVPTPASVLSPTAAPTPLPETPLEPTVTPTAIVVPTPTPGIPPFVNSVAHTPSADPDDPTHDAELATVGFLSLLAEWQGDATSADLDIDQMALFVRRDTELWDEVLWDVSVMHVENEVLRFPEGQYNEILESYTRDDGSVIVLYCYVNVAVLYDTETGIGVPRQPATGYIALEVEYVADLAGWRVTARQPLNRVDRVADCDEVDDGSGRDL